MKNGKVSHIWQKYILHCRWKVILYATKYYTGNVIFEVLTYYADTNKELLGANTIFRIANVFFWISWFLLRMYFLDLNICICQVAMHTVRMYAQRPTVFWHKSWSWQLANNSSSIYMHWKWSRFSVPKPFHIITSYYFWFD